MYERPGTERKVGSRVVSRLRRVAGESLVRNGSLVIATTLVNGALGAVFWVVAARGHDDTEVGRASALLAAVGGASLLANLGLGSVLIDRLPRRRSQGSWARTVGLALVVGAALSAVAGAVTAAALPELVRDLDVYRGDAAVLVLVALGAAVTTAGLLTDSVFLAERRSEWYLARNTAFGTAKLVLVALTLGAGGAVAITGSWVVALGASTVAATLVGFRELGRPLPFGSRPGTEGWKRELADLAPHSLLHHLANLGAQLPVYGLPLIVVAQAGARETAWFTVTWLVAGVFFTVSPAAAQALFAEGSHHPERLDALLRRGAVFTAALLLPLALGALALGWFVLSLFGRSYATAGYPALCVLVAGSVPDAVTNLLIARWRVERRLVRVAGLNLAMAGGALLLAWRLVPGLGTLGAALAWVAAQGAGAAWAVVVARRARPATVMPVEAAEAA